MSTVFDDEIIKIIAGKVRSLLSVNDIYRETHCLVSLYNCIDSLCEHFGRVEMLEHYGNYMKLRVQR